MMELPIGFSPFHKQKFFNYQMNRLHSLGFARKADIERAAAQIADRSDYVAAFRQEAVKAKEEGRLINSAAYLRAAEFFVKHDSPEKLAIYREYREAFYNALPEEKIARFEVPYSGSFLPAMELNPDDRSPKGTILLFGGFDSLIEEFFVIWKYLSVAGYRVIAFEGPGQGAALKLYDRTADHDWEKPVAAVLNYFQVERAALIGISMGGYWAIRAAAFEPRISQVVSWSPVYDWMEQIPGFAQRLVFLALKWEGMMNATIRLRMRLFPILDHAVRQAMDLVRKDQPIDAVRWMLGMNKSHLSSERVTQDVLLVGGENDAFQPVRLLRKQEAALVQARSVTTRIFTRAEHADQHCQMGNLNLALREITAWLDEKLIPAD